MPTVGDVADYLNRFAPTARAAEWDNVGLILGERSALVNRILTCLTVTPEVVDEAVQSKANLIVTHHPLLFRPVQKITDAWLATSNLERPHDSLGQVLPLTFLPRRGVPTKSTFEVSI